MAENEVIFRLILNSEGFIGGLRNSSAGMNSCARMRTTRKSPMLAVGAVAATVVTGLVGLTLKAASTGDELLKLSKQSGLSVERISLLRFAAEQSETNINELTQGLKFLSRAMLEAGDSSSKQAQIFKALEISTIDTATGAVRPLEQVMLDLADAFKGLPDGATKTTVAVQLLGRAGQQLIPFLNEGRDGIEALTAKAKELGLEWDAKTAKAADKLGDQLKELRSQISGTGENLGKLLVGPALDFLGWLNATLLAINKVKEQGFKDFNRSINETIGAVSGFSKARDIQDKLEQWNSAFQRGF